MRDPYGDLTEFKGSVSKGSQLARGTRRYRRRVASPARWQRIIDEKNGPCRVCGTTGNITFHHLTPKSLGGDDQAANIVPLCGSGTTGCHGLIEARDKAACKALRESLTDEEYAYVTTSGGPKRPRQGGEGFIEAMYPVKFEDVA